MRYLSVCSGIEAATVAWHPLGWEPVAFAEIEKFPSTVLAHHYPSIPNWGDLTKFREWPDATIDLLVGGTPCQSFSVAGLRKGLDDPRGSLLFAYLAAADRYRPRWLVWENVPGVLSIDGGRAFGALLGGLGQLGYGFAYCVRDAQYFGLAQRRARVFVVGHLGDWRRAAAVLFERESLSGHPAPRREAGEGTACSTAPSLTASGRGVERTGESRGQDPVVAVPKGHCIHGVHWASECRDCGIWRYYPNQLPERWRALTSSNQRIDYETETLIVPIDMRQASRGATMTNNRAEGASGGAPGTGIGEDGDPSPTIASSHVPAVAFNWQSGGDARGLKAQAQAQALSRSQTPAVAFQEAQTGCREYDTAGTLRADGPGHDPVGTRIREGMQVRRLTPRECERLQGFPDDYTLIPYRGKLAADGPRYKALGNSMAVPVMAWIGRRIALLEQIIKERVA
jgi:DNA (cytosine-5)-methyltransferase 1